MNSHPERLRWNRGFHRHQTFGWLTSSKLRDL